MIYSRKNRNFIQRKNNRWYKYPDCQQYDAGQKENRLPYLFPDVPGQGIVCFPLSGYLFKKMDSCHAGHIVPGTRIYKIIDLLSLLNTLIFELIDSSLRIISAFAGLNIGFLDQTFVFYPCECIVPFPPGKAGY